MAEVAAGVRGEPGPKGPKTANAPTDALRKHPALAGLLLIVATVVLYYPVHGHPFINYDTRDYVYENPRVESGLTAATLHWAFTTFDAGNWHPLTWVSHALDCQLFGLNPGGHHETSVLFHGLNAALLFWVLLRATGSAGRSFMVAALFALHPINVESVAWVAERKTVLSMMFFLLALGAYQWYARRPRVGRYAVVAALFALGLMAKPQIITLPFVLLLWDYWPLQRMFADGGASPSATNSANFQPAGKTLAALILEKLPLLLIAAASAMVTLKAQQGARVWYPRPYRLGNAVLSYVLYIKNTFWPAKLAVLYPHPGTSLSWWKTAAAALLLLAITALVLIGRRHRYLPVGWFWFLGTLVPMLGIVQVGIQAMADRYAYISVLGLFLMVTWGAADWAEQKALPAFLLPAVGSVVLLLLAISAHRQIGYWRSDEALWAHTLQITTGNFEAESQLGTALAIEGRIAQAMPHFYKAVALCPGDINSHMGIAIYDVQQRNYRDAILHYQVVLTVKQLKPSLLVRAYEGMAKSYQALGDTAHAQEYLRAARNVIAE